MIEKNKKLVINCSNLHGGGGLQVAVAFITDLISNEELTSHMRDEVQFILIMSLAVESELKEDLIKIYCFFDIVEVLDAKGILAVFYSLKIARFKPNLIFTIFGPNYFVSKSRKVTGFAQPWIIYPSLKVYRKIKGLTSKFITYIKYELQWLYFKHDDFLIVELPHVKSALMNTRGFDSSKIAVVENSLNPAIPQNNNEIIRFKNKNGCIDFGLVSRGYPHKNIEFAIALIAGLREKYNLNLRLHLTLSKDESTSLNADECHFIVNHGPIAVKELGFFYEKIDAVILPSLLECFSATPLEALYYRKILFCSDLPFMKDCVASHAVYFDPYNLEGSVSQIGEFLDELSREDFITMTTKGFEFFNTLPSSYVRSRKYLDIILNEIAL